ncbi:uncharacterized protein [Eurosta solidaginis]|uniref:uncharacterized protein n=1 Tax=Eurosta solidaginis TaxID=178769 RepID=UPI00353142C4
MDPTKQLGIGKEQAETEREARHNFQKKWAKLGDKRLNRIYNQNEVNKELKEMLQKQELCPYEYTGQGDSYFTSPDMYNSLLAKCRCGRKRSETHILKCLQKAANTTDSLLTSNQINASTHGEMLNNDKEMIKNDSNRVNDKSLPRTSNSFIGWQKRPSTYKQWENSMKHISSIATMTEPRLTSTGYHVLHIA